MNQCLGVPRIESNDSKGIIVVEVIVARISPPAKLAFLGATVSVPLNFGKVRHILGNIEEMLSDVAAPLNYNRKNGK